MSGFFEFFFFFFRRGKKSYSRGFHQGVVARMGNFNLQELDGFSRK